MKSPTQAALDARYNGRAAVDSVANAPQSPVPVKPGAAAAVVQSPAPPPAKETP